MHYIYGLNLYNFYLKNHSLIKMSTVNGVFTPSPQKKKVMIGMKGSTYTNQFLVAWTMTLNHIWKNTNYDVYVVQGFSKNQFVSRLQSLGLDLSKDKDQTAFQGMDYDVYVMIDPEMIFKPEDLCSLIEKCLTKHDVVSGLYLIEPSLYFAGDSTGKELIKVKDVPEDDKETIEVPFTGLGFFACKKKVIDALEYPYFTNVLTEDVTFCRNLKEKGFSVMLAKDLRVGREMNVVL